MNSDIKDHPCYISARHGYSLLFPIGPELDPTDVTRNTASSVRYNHMMETQVEPSKVPELSSFQGPHG